MKKNSQCKFLYAFRIVVCAISTRNSTYFWKAQLKSVRACNVQTANLFSAKILHGTEQRPISLKNAPRLCCVEFSRPHKAFRDHCIECHVAVSGILSKLRLMH